jgi:type I restriction enzyme S subunit
MGLQNSVPCWVVGRMTDKLPFGGEVVRLGELVESSKAKNKDGLFADVYSVTNSHGFVPSQEYFNKEVYSKELRTYRVVHRNMIAYNPSRINIGSVAVQDKVDNAIVSPLYVVFSADETKIIPGYLVRFLRSKPGLDQIAQQSIGTVRSNLKFDALCKMQMPLPSLQTQVERMNKLTLVEQLADGCENYLFHLDELVKSRFVEMFGDPIDTNSTWPRKPIKDFCELRIGPFGSSLHRRDYIEGGHALINPSHIVNGAIVPDMSLTISDERYSEMDPYHLEIGDVVLGRRGEIGRCAVVCKPGLLCGTGSMIVRPKAGCRPDYLQRVISFPSFKDALEANAVGQTMKNLNAKIVGNAVVALPPIKVQDEFASFVERVDKLRVVAEKEKQTLQTLYDSLAQEYFAI